MFTSLKSFIDSRLGKGVVLDEFTNDFGYFIKVNHQHFYALISFLKNDPDLRLTLLDQIIAIPSQLFSQMDIGPTEVPTLEILYQLKSLKLPYRVTLILEINKEKSTIPSIAPLFLGARWLEEDLSRAHNVVIGESDREK